jgi:hypothetical protein
MGTSPSAKSKEQTGASTSLMGSSMLGKVKMTFDLAICSGAHSLGGLSLENGVAGVIGVAAKSATSGNAWNYASYARHARETAEAERIGLTLQVESDQCLPISGLKRDGISRELPQVQRSRSFRGMVWPHARQLLCMIAKNGVKISAWDFTRDGKTFMAPVPPFAPVKRR